MTPDARGAVTTGSAGNAEHEPRRMEHLLQLSKLFATFEDMDQTFDPALRIVVKTLPLRSAIVIEAEGERSRMIVWGSKAQTSDQMWVARANAEAAFGYLVGAALNDLTLTERAGISELPLDDAAAPALANRFIVIPLVLHGRPPFGALQVEGAKVLDESDLKFVNAIANQLAVALERDRSWREDIARRKQAEQRQFQLELKAASAEHARLMADSSKNEYQALAEENASLYEQAQKAVGAREQILAVVSHDLRNPLGVIRLTIEGLAGTAAATKGLPESLSRIERAAARMLGLIEDLLDFASIEAGNLAIKRQSDEPGTLLRETLATFEHQATKRLLRLTAVEAPNLPRVSFDRDRLLQVLSNLVGNAAKATPEGGQIALTVAGEGEALLFSVADSGHGIKEEDAKHLFERYWRGDRAQYKGTGLGLAIAKGLVHAHGGRIWLDSAVGRGTTFFFTVPPAAIE